MYFHDESLFSFLFRTQLIYGYHNFHNLLTLNGRVSDHLKAQKELIPIYNRMSEKCLYLVINTHNHDEISFSQPYKDLSKVKEFLDKGCIRECNRLSKSFRYCNECIEENCNSFGIGYLKRSWDIYKDCYKHKTPLSEIIPHTYNSSVEIMMGLILGIKPNPKDIFTHKKNESMCSLQTIEVTKPLSSLYIKPCAFILMEKWIYRNRIKLVPFLPKSMWDTNLTPTLTQLTKHPSSFVSDIYNARNNDNFQAFRDFVSENTIIIQERFGVIQKNSFSFNIMKAKNINCLTCKVRKSAEKCHLQNNCDA